MENLILQYYPDPAFYTYMFLVEKCGDKDFCQVDVDKQHLEDLEISGFIKLIDNKIFVKEQGKWLHEPPKPKFKQKKEPFKNPRLDKLADIVGYPTDWHKREKYESLFRTMVNKHGWEELQKVAKYFAENRKSSELVLNYFLSKDGYKGIRYRMENPAKEKEEKILFRGDITKDQEDTSWQW